jgi:hypothetical protein
VILVEPIEQIFVMSGDDRRHDLGSGMTRAAKHHSKGFSLAGQPRQRGRTKRVERG